MSQPKTDSAGIANASDRRASIRGKRVAVLLYSSYPSDTRVNRACEAMIEAGLEVDLLCLRETNDEPLKEVVGGVNVFRLPQVHSRGGALVYIWNYGRFILSALWFVIRHGTSRRYDLVHVHNMPDVLVFGSLYAKLRGAPVVLDLHDPTPELMITIFGFKEGQFAIRLLKFLEKLSIWFADSVITTNIAFKTLFASRSCRPEKITIVMNSPQGDIFNPDRFANDESGRLDDGEFRIMHHGSILHRHGIDLLIEAVARVRPKIPGVRLDIFGPPTPFLDTLLDLAKRLGVADVVRYHGSKNPYDIAKAIRSCHLGVVPNRRSPFTEINFPTRLFEYLAMHRPVIGPDTQGVRDYFSPDQIIYFEPGSTDDLEAKILWVWENPVEVRAVVERGVQVYRENLWAEEKTRFIDLLADQLLPLSLTRLLIATESPTAMSPAPATTRPMNPTENLRPIATPADRILVTGSNGFIGAKVVERLLESGFTNLRCFVRPSSRLDRLKAVCQRYPGGENVQFITGDLLSRDDCVKAVQGVSLVYHIAAGMDKSFAGAFMNSALTTRNLMDAFLQHGTPKRFVSIGSFAVYSNFKLSRGDLLDETCPLEDAPNDRYDAYGFGKLKQDELVMQYGRERNLPYVILRPGTVFGPGKEGLSGRVGINTFGIFIQVGGSNLIPLTFVDNCAEAIVLAGLRPGIDGEVFNVVDDELLTGRQFLREYNRRVRDFRSLRVPYFLAYAFCYFWELYCRRSQGQLPPVFNRRRCSAEWKPTRFSNQRLHERLGWKPRVSLKSALATMVRPSSPIST